MHWLLQHASLGLALATAVSSEQLMLPDHPNDLKRHAFLPSMTDAALMPCCMIAGPPCPHMQ